MPARPLKYGRLKATHPQYDLAYWQELRALYEGGKALLRDDALFERLFPKHANEKPGTYDERKRRAYYVGHLSTVIDRIVAGLSADPVELVPPGGDEPDEYYKKLAADVTPPRGRRQSLQQLVLEQSRVGLLLGRIWTLVDMPPKPKQPRASEADQRVHGDLDAYLVPIPPEEIIFWEESGDGEILWAMRKQCSRRRPRPEDERNVLTETYTLYEGTEWTRYVVERKDGADGPDDETLIEPDDHGTTSFGRVPLLHTEISPGLWAGNKLHSLAVEFLNKSCGLSWAEFKALYSQLYEFLPPELPGIDEAFNENAQGAAEKARNSKRGPGYLQIRPAEARAEYVGPDTGAFGHAANTLKRLGEDIYRVMYQMALAEDNSGALIRRSAESKDRDHAVTEVVLGALGEVMRCLVVEAVDTIAVGRRDSEGWGASGLEEFEGVDVAADIDQAIGIESLQIPSATYQRARKLRLVKADLGDEATPEVIKTIEQELATAITQDQLLGMPQREPREPPPRESPTPGDEEDDSAAE